MSDISLREYTRKIENLIDNNEIDQAISHCKYILQIYPKHLDSYRLLGKAFLEKQKYSDASDIFQRVLSSIPDDFISHIGMSIIREDENNVDAAIWHMERAFEVQPSNKAVQDELRRLYTNRDGVAPPKIRLTRGALVRMYSRGELFDQAIGEINAALDEDPNRVDLEVLLARIYFQLGKKIEATETCSKLITKLPYCYEANKILTEVLPGTSREEDQKIFKQRIIELDPYIEFITDQISNSSDVSDSKIKIEYQEWDPLKDAYDQPDWAKSIGLEVDSEKSLENDISFWLSDSELMATDTEVNGKNLPEQPFIDEGSSDEKFEEPEDIITPTEQPVEIDTAEEEDLTLISKMPIEEIDQGNSESTDSADYLQPESPDEDFPEWLKDAGWEKSENEDPEILKGFSISALIDEENQIEKCKEDIDNEEDIIEPAEIPDWVQEIAPKDKITDQEEIEFDDEFEVQNLEDLLSNFDKSNSEMDVSDTTFLWENEFDSGIDSPMDQLSSEIEFKELEDKTEPLTQINEIKDVSIESEDEDLDWLKSIQFEEEDVKENEIAQSIIDFPEKDVDSRVEVGDEIGSEENWLSSLLDEKKDEINVPFSSIEQEQELEDNIEIANDVPDWIKSVISEKEQPATDNVIHIEEEVLELNIFEDNPEPEEIDDIKISFDESDEFEISENQEMSEQTEPLNQDAYEEQLVHETLSKLEEEFSKRSEEASEDDEITPEKFDIDLDSSEIEDATDKEKTISDFEWLRDVEAVQQIDETGETEIVKHFESEETPEWVSDILKSVPEDEQEEFDSTPSWLRELEIETDNMLDSDEQPFGLSELETESANDQEFVKMEDEVGAFESTIDISEIDEAEVEVEEVEELFLDKEANLFTPSEEVDFDIEEVVVKDSDIQISDLPFVIDEPESDSIPISEIVTLEIVDDLSPDLEVDLEQIPEEIQPITPEDLVGDLEEISPEEIDEENMLEQELIIELEEERDESIEPDLALSESESEEAIDKLDSTISKDHYEDTDLEIQVQKDEEIEEILEETSVIDQSILRINDLKEANNLLNNGELDQSIEIYHGLIRDELYLEDIINDIQSALNHHYPIDINLWQTLGDAYLKNKQLQKALDAYSKAEDLLS